MEAAAHASVTTESLGDLLEPPGRRHVGICALRFRLACFFAFSAPQSSSVMIGVGTEAAVPAAARLSLRSPAPPPSLPASAPCSSRFSRGSN